MTNLNNEICELSLNELDGVSGGTWMDTVICVTSAVKAINGINSILTQAVDGIPPRRATRRDKGRPVYPLEAASVGGLIVINAGGCIARNALPICATL